MSLPPDILYSRAAADDLPAVVELCMLVEAQHEAYWPLRWQRRPGLAEGYLRWLSHRVSEPRMLIQVAKDPALPDHTVVGTILATIEKEVPIYAYSEYAYVQDMAVLPSHRRRGIAQRLLADAADWATSHGLNQLRIMVAQQNHAARKLFQNSGFRDTYQEMILPLNPPPTPGSSPQ